MEKDPRTHKIIGAAMEAHSIIGPGHLEAGYYKERKLKKYLENLNFTLPDLGDFMKSPNSHSLIFQLQ